MAVERVREGEAPSAVLAFYGFCIKLFDPADMTT